MQRLLYILVSALLVIGPAAPATARAQHGRHQPTHHHKRHHHKRHHHKRHHHKRHHHKRHHHKKKKSHQGVRRPTLPAPTALPSPAPAPQPAPAPKPAPSPTPLSAWDRPALESPTTVVIDAQHSSLVLDQTRDYVLTIGGTVPASVSIWGGHNVVLDGGTLNVSGVSGGMQLKQQTGEIWIHNLHISGSQLMEGIDLDERQPGATVVLRNILVDTVHGSYETNHADVIQTWAGPSRLLIDGLTASTDYQGFFLLPRQQWSAGPWPALFDFRHVDIVDDGGYAFWRDSHNPYPQYLSDVYVRPNPAKPSREWWLWPKPSTGDTSWAAVVAGSPPGGSFVLPAAAGALPRPDLPPPVPLAGEGV